MKKIKLLMVDNYDSFTYNIVQYFGELGAEIEVFRNDQITIEGIAQRNPDRLVISPGSCSPLEAGISVAAIQHFAGKLPILGVCLGHQSIGAAFGGKSGGRAVRGRGRGRSLSCASARHIRSEPSASMARSSSRRGNDAADQAAKRAAAIVDELALEGDDVTFHEALHALVLYASRGFEAELAGGTRLGAKKWDLAESAALALAARVPAAKE
jgi:hypothetical protein